MHRAIWRWLAVAAGIVSLAALTGCGNGGNVTNDRNALAQSPDSSIAGPAPINLNDAAAWNTVPEAESIDRTQFGTQLALTGPARLSYSLTSDELAHAAHGLAVFIDPRLSNSSGVGPYFNQRNCLGCHQSQLSSPPPDFADPANGGYSSFPPRIPSPDSRARTEDAFLTFGDYNPGSGAFNPLAAGGGPVLHRQNLPGFPPQSLPPLTGGGEVRVTGMRASPPYIARGLMEALPDDEILMRTDDFGTGINGPGIRGMENRNSEATSSFIGASPTVRLSRFGLRGAGPGLVQFMLGGLTGEIGLTTPFTPSENFPTALSDGVPDPETTVDDVRDLNTLIRMMAPPVRHLNVGPASLVDGPDNVNNDTIQQPPDNGADLIASENRGRMLFGADYTLPFGFRPPPPGAQTPGALLADPNGPNLNCAGCHTPVMITGISPANVGAEHLTGKRFYPFSDMLMHHMGTVDVDFVLPLGVSGRASPDQWRTPPLMGLGLTGPPFWHDGRFRAELGIDEALREAIEAHDSPGSEAQIQAQAFKMLEANPITVNGVTYTAKDLMNFVEGL
ncbi:MAG TPA: di-heme oxidoredictase family protein [Armatimonadota bacterium]|nr:di-heme oxidoredictase family protein [Armatimonadota bacterium]